MTDAREHVLLLALAVVLVIIVAVGWWAWDECHLPGGLSRKGCPQSGKGSFCGVAPDPAAMAEAAGLYELGVRPAGEGFCGTAPAPAAMAEAQGLMQMGWRPEHLRPRPACAGPAPAAISEAQSLQHAGALAPGAPYYAPREAFQSGGGCGAVSAEASGETRLLRALQALPSAEGGVDRFAAHRLLRDGAANARARGRSETLRSNPAQTSARQARLDSMREGFGGPAGAGYGWSPSAADVAASPATAGWGDAQSVGAAVCYPQCLDGCQGTHCQDYCKDRCRSQSLLAATGNY
jgi:hypothetical protein